MTSRENREEYGKSCAAAQVLGADKDEWSQTRQQIGASIDIFMGGRVAEELVFGADQARHPHSLRTQSAF